VTERELIILRGDAERAYAEAKERGDQTLMATTRAAAIRYNEILRHMRGVTAE
jgi:hypothetical protein